MIQWDAKDYFVCQIDQHDQRKEVRDQAFEVICLPFCSLNWVLFYFSLKLYNND